MRLEYFEMIDHVDYLSLDDSEIKCSCTIPSESPVFEGHFPGQPIMPGVLMTEMMAQASGYFAVYRSSLEKMGYLSGIEKARFRDFLIPGSPVQVFAKEVHEGSGYSVFQCRIESNGKKIANAEVRLKLANFTSDELAECMRKRLESSGLALNK